MFGGKVYELPLARDYVSKWGVVEAVRELLQNAIDSPAPFDVKQIGDSLTITSRGVRLDASTLVLGRTSKADDNGSIGQFGEGYKLALLVLSRESKNPLVVNGKVTWRPFFDVSSQFGIETLHIAEAKTDREAIDDAVKFIIQGLSGEEQSAIKQSCLHMQDLYPDTIMTPHGDILPNLPGKLFVGGLFVCNTSMHYGYNFNPGEIELERDRQTVGDFDLAWKTKEAWLSTMKYEFIAEMMEKDLPDVRLMQFSSPELVKEACYRHFKQHHPDTVMAKDNDELQDLVKRGMTVYVGGGAYYANVTQSKSYTSDPVAVVKRTPVEELTAWYNENKRYMPRIPSAAFKVLLKRAEGWKL